MPKDDLRRAIGIFDFEFINLDADFGRMYCAVIKEYGTDNKAVIRADDFPEFRQDAAIDGDVCEAIRDELEKYTWLVGQFSVFHDIKYLQTRLLKNQRALMYPLPRKNHIDTWLLAKKHLKLGSNGLWSLGRLVSAVDEKTPIEPAEWLRAIRQDTQGRQAMDYIVEHCIADVDITEKVFSEFMPLTKSLF